MQEIDAKFSAVSNLMQRLSGAWLGQALNAAISLGVADAIDATPVRADSLAERLHAHGPTLYRLLRALAANGVFEEKPGQQFAHNTCSRALRRDARPSMVPMLNLMGMQPGQAAWGKLADGVRDGRSPFEHAHGTDLYAFLGQHADHAEMFNQAMLMHSMSAMGEILAGYPKFAESRQILDIGGGLGHFLVAILTQHSAARGAVFDLPQMRAPCEAYLATTAVAARASFTAGDFRTALPEGYDTYVIKNALWNWDDADALRIMRNVRRAMGSTPGRFLVIEQLITPENAAETTLFDLQMLVLPGGRSRTPEQYVAMGQEAGLKAGKPLALGPTHLVEFTNI